MAAETIEQVQQRFTYTDFDVGRLTIRLAQWGPWNRAVDELLYTDDPTNLGVLYDDHRSANLMRQWIQCFPHADLNYKESCIYKPPLFVKVAMYGPTSFLQELVENPRCDVHIRNYGGMNALTRAIKARKIEHVPVLMRAGVEVQWGVFDLHAEPTSDDDAIRWLIHYMQAVQIGVAATMYRRQLAVGTLPVDIWRRMRELLYT